MFELLIAQGKEMTAKSLKGQHKEFKLVVKQRVSHKKLEMLFKRPSSD